MTPLKASADFLRTFGWRQDVLFDSSGGACLVGAVYAMAPLEDFTQCMAELVTRLGLDPGRMRFTELMDWLVIWNDEPGRRLEEVLDLLDPQESAHGANAQPDRHCEEVGCRSDYGLRAVSYGEAAV